MTAFIANLVLVDVKEEVTTGEQNRIEHKLYMKMHCVILSSVSRKSNLTHNPATVTE